MAVFSALKSVFTRSNHVASICTQNQYVTCRQIAAKFGTSAIRQSGGHKRTMEVKPSRFEWTQFKDHLHFYVMLGAIPIGALVTATNLLYQRPKLVDIPEGYEPRYWEYFKHPISRFIARYLHESPQKKYERHMHYLDEEKRKAKMRLLEWKVKRLMSERGDYKGWYYMPVTPTRTYEGAHFEARRSEDETFAGPGL